MSQQASQLPGVTRLGRNGRQGQVPRILPVHRNVWSSHGILAPRCRLARYAPALKSHGTVSGNQGRACGISKPMKLLARSRTLAPGPRVSRVKCGCQVTVTLHPAPGLCALDLPKSYFLHTSAKNKPPNVHPVPDTCP